MKTLSGMQVGVIALLIGLAASLPSTAAIIVWSDNFNDGTSTGWRQHRTYAADVTGAYLVVAGAGVGGSYGFVRSDIPTPDPVAQGAEAIYTTTSIPEGPAYEMSASVKLAPTGASRVGLTWGYATTGSPVQNYLIEIQNHDRLQLWQGDVGEPGYTSLFADGPSQPAGTFDDFVTLSATFVKEGADLRITGFLNGVQQFSYLDTTSPLIFNPCYAGVYSTFGSNGTVFDNVVVQEMAIPEPATAGLLLAGLGLATCRKRRTGCPSVRS